MYLARQPLYNIFNIIHCLSYTLFIHVFQHEDSRIVANDDKPDMLQEIDDPFASRPKIPRGDESQDVAAALVSSRSPENPQPVTPRRRSSRLNKQKDDPLSCDPLLNNTTPIRRRFRNSTANTSAMGTISQDTTNPPSMKSVQDNATTQLANRSRRKTPVKKTPSKHQTPASDRPQMNSTVTLDAAKDISVTTTMSTSEKEQQMSVDYVVNEISNDSNVPQSKTLFSFKWV